MGDEVFGALLSFVNICNFVLVERVWSLDIFQFC